MSQLTITLSADVEDKLGRLADSTRRSKSTLVAEAVADYVARELEVIDGIRAGLEDSRTGRLVDHHEAMAELDEVLAAADQKHRS